MPLPDERSVLVVRISLAAFDIAGALVVLLAVFGGLPARWWPVDAGALAAAASLIAMAASQLTRVGWVRVLARAGGFVTLGLGLSFIAALAATFSYMAAIYGPVGRGGSLISALVAALALPYLVVLPALHLLGFGRPGAREAPRA